MYSYYADFIDEMSTENYSRIKNYYRIRKRIASICITDVFELQTYKSKFSIKILFSILLFQRENSISEKYSVERK